MSYTRSLPRFAEIPPTLPVFAGPGSVGRPETEAGTDPAGPIAGVDDAFAPNRKAAGRAGRDAYFKASISARSRRKLASPGFLLRPIRRCSRAAFRCPWAIES